MMPVTIETFLKHVQDSSKSGAEKLSREWLAECCAIIDSHRENIEQWMPSHLVGLLQISSPICRSSCCQCVYLCLVMTLIKINDTY